VSVGCKIFISLPQAAIRTWAYSSEDLNYGWDVLLRRDFRAKFSIGAHKNSSIHHSYISLPLLSRTRRILLIIFTDTARGWECFVLPISAAICFRVSNFSVSTHCLCNETFPAQLCLRRRTLRAHAGNACICYFIVVLSFNDAVSSWHCITSNGKMVSE
jgi:hypothetical protein